jgi:hypothetical protein
MVQSLIDKTINYSERRDMYEEDLNYNSALYEISIFDTYIAVCIGNMRTDKNDIVYYPIYIVRDDENGETTVSSQIGVFEVLAKECLSVLDEDNNLCLSKIDKPLFYSFVTEKLIKKINSDPKKYADNIISDKPTIDKTIINKSILLDDGNKSEKEYNKQEEAKGDESLFSLNVEETRETKIIKEKLKNGVFETKPKFEKPLFLEEEIESTAAEIVANYKESKKDPWIQQCMKNPNYDIIDVESNGDCLFAVIREAYKENGYITTVSKLRAIVANELTESIFNHQMEIYNMYENEKTTLEKEIQIIKREIEDPHLKDKLKGEKNKEKKKSMMKETNDKIQIFNGKVVEYKYSVENLKEYDFMKNLKTIEDFRNYIMTSNYWADAWAIFVLEQSLKMKMIIFGEESFEGGDLDNVINCGYSLQENVNSFAPNFYIMASYSGNHYRNITYKNKKLLTFVEVPYYAKILIIKKCMEKNAGIYNLIQDFRDLKTRLRVKDSTDDEQTGGNNDYNEDGDKNDDVFTFYRKSSKKPLPGRGVAEKINLSETNTEYAHLAKIDDWRRKLDDSWEQNRLIRLDNKHWKSVEHYILGSQYKKGFPDVYFKFSSDAETDISENLSLAKKSSNTLEGVLVNGEMMKCKKDSTYDEKESRDLAVRAKFSQNEDFRKILNLTKNAVLQKFIPGDKPVVDHLLMKIRGSNSKNTAH